MSGGRRAAGEAGSTEGSPRTRLQEILPRHSRESGNPVTWIVARSGRRGASGCRRRFFLVLLQSQRVPASAGMTTRETETETHGHRHVPRPAAGDNFGRAISTQPTNAGHPMPDQLWIFPLLGAIAGVLA